MRTECFPRAIPCKSHHSCKFIRDWRTLVGMHARAYVCVCVDKEGLQIKLYIYATTYMRYVLFLFGFNTLTATPKLHFFHSICQDIRWQYKKLNFITLSFNTTKTNAENHFILMESKYPLYTRYNISKYVVCWWNKMSDSNRHIRSFSICVHYLIPY